MKPKERKDGLFDNYLSEVESAIIRGLERAFYQSGGTLPLDSGSYVPRAADRDLVEALVAGEYCYLLNSRQIGKSSLCVRAMDELSRRGLRVAFLDLTKFGGKNLTAEQWYVGLLREIGRTLGLAEPMLDAWKTGSGLGPMQRFFGAISEVAVLSGSPLVVLLDEIDATRGLPFDTDEFFAGIREYYNRRVHDEVSRNLTFCLIGVAIPSDLIQDPSTTPFNIGRRIELRDFTEEEAMPLASGLGPEGEKKIRRILYWTGGHPYLTQAVCAESVAHTEESIDRIVERMFFLANARETNVNFADVQNRLFGVVPDGVSPEEHRAAVLDRYDQVRSQRKSVRDDETDRFVSMLKLCGLTRVLDGYLCVRNRIYLRVFDLDWIRSQMPNAELERQRRAAKSASWRVGLVAGAVAVAIGGLAVFGFAKAREAEARTRDALVAKVRGDRLLYQTNMSLIQTEFEANHFGRVKELLDESAMPVYADFRGSEWGYWDYLMNTQLVALKGHTRDVVSASFSADGSRIVTASLDKTSRVWNARDGSEIAVLEGRFKQLMSAAFSPDGTRIVAGSLDKTVHVWDAQDGREVARLKGNIEVIDASYSPDGTCMVTTSVDASARVWDARDGREVAVLTGHQGSITDTSFSPDGTRIVTASQDRTARVWDARDGREITALKGHTDEVVSASFSPDGSRIVTASRDKTAREWDARNGREIFTLKGHTEILTVASFSPDGSRIVTASRDTTARVWDARDGRETMVLKGHARDVDDASFSPDGSRIVTASRDLTARIWDARDGREMTVLKGHTGVLHEASFSTDGTKILTASADGTARVWDAREGRDYAALRGHKDLVITAAFSPDMSRIVTASFDQTGRVWDAQDGHEIATLKGHKWVVHSASFSPDGSRIVTSSWDKTAREWDAQDGHEILTLNGHTDYVYWASFSPDGGRIVTSSRDKTARVWDAMDGREVTSFGGHSGLVFTASYSPDGSRIVTSSSDTTARLWNSQSGTRIDEFTGHPLTVYSASFSPDGKRIVTASDDATARVWDVLNRRQIFALNGHAKSVTDASFSPDGSRIVTASYDLTSRVWDARDGREIFALKGHTEGVRSVSFSPDGQYLLLASGNEARILPLNQEAAKKLSFVRQVAWVADQLEDSARHKDLFAWNWQMNHYVTPELAGSKEIQAAFQAAVKSPSSIIASDARKRISATSTSGTR